MITIEAIECETLTEAIEKSGRKPTFNQRDFEREVRDIEEGHRNPPPGFGPSKGVRFFVTQDDEPRVLYTYQCDILILNEFDFHGIHCLDNSPFHPVWTDFPVQSGKEGTIQIEDLVSWDKCRQNRNIFRKRQMLVTTLVA